MCMDTADDKDSIARELGWPDYGSAPAVVQNNIDDGLEPNVSDPFAFLEVE